MFSTQPNLSKAPAPAGLQESASLHRNYSIVIVE